MNGNLMVAKCGADTNAGGKCIRAPMPNGRCWVHGGATPAGSASPHFKTGRYSKYFPKAIVDRAEEAEHDPDLLSSRGEIALCRSRIQGLGSMIGAGEGDAKTWASIAEWIDTMGRAMDRERKRLIAIEAAVTAEQVRMIVVGIAEAVQKHVPDDRQRYALLRDIQSLLQK